MPCALTFTECLQLNGEDFACPHFGPQQGLTMRVNSIVQDSIGYLYFAGNQGLVRYDGVEFKHFVNIYDDTTSISAGEVYKRRLVRTGSFG